MFHVMWMSGGCQHSDCSVSSFPHAVISGGMAQWSKTVKWIITFMITGFMADVFSCVHDTAHFFTVVVIFLSR